MEETNLLDFVETLRRRWVTAAIVFVVVVAAGVAYSIFVAPRTYTANTQIIVTADSRSSLSMAMMGAGGTANIPGLSWLNLARPQSQWQFMSVLCSETMRLEVAKKLDLKTEFRVRDDYHAAALLKNIAAPTWTETGTIAVSATCAGTPRGLFPDPNDDMEARKLAADIANAHIDVLREWLDENAIDETTRRARDAEAQLKRAKADAAEAQRALAAYKEEHGIVELSAQAQELIAAHAEASGLLVAAQGRLDAAQARLKHQKEAMSSIYDQPSSALPASPELAALQERLEAKRAELNAERQVYRAGHPNIIALEQELAALQTSYEEARTRAQRATDRGLAPTLVQLDAEVKAARAEVSRLESKLRKIEADLLKGPSMELGYRQLELEAKSKETMVGQFELQAMSQRVLAGDSASQFTVLDEAHSPITRTKPKLKVNLAVAMALGLFLGCVVVAVREMSARRRSRPTAPTAADAA
jgi:GumC protein